MTGSASRLLHRLDVGRRCRAVTVDGVSGLIDKNRSIMGFTCSGTSSWRKYPRRPPLADDDLSVGFQQEG